jgi:hypothetical protein
VTDPALPTDPSDAPRGRTPRDDWKASWEVSLALGLATLMVACGLALAFGWTHLERAMDARALFR